MKITLFISLAFISIAAYSQVGIGTTSPTAQLDIKGDLKVRTTNLDTSLISAKDSVVVVNKGVISRITSKQVYDSHIKSFVKGITASGTTALGVTIGGGYKKIPFDTEVLDKNNDYDNGVYEFTAPKDGIYQVYVQSHLYALAAVSSVGVAVFSKHGTDPVKLEAEEDYGSLAILSSTVRRTQTLVELSAGDKIFFGGPDSGISLVSGSKSFFTIMQVE